MSSYLKGVGSTRVTPQREPIPSARQVPNSEDAYVWAVDSLARLRRFLVLGSEGGSYYATEQKLTRENADAVRVALDEHGPEAVHVIVGVSLDGRAPKVAPAIYALAMASGHSNEEVRKAALDAVPFVCRTGAHLFTYMSFVGDFRGEGPAFRRAIGKWYLDKDVDALAYQLVKYRQRDGWTHRDVLRVAHPEPVDGSPRDQALRWAVGKTPRYKHRLPEAILAYEDAQQASTPERTRDLIVAYGDKLPREALKTEHLADAGVWRALVDEGMPMTALLRNLATMTRLGVLRSGGDERTARVIAQLTDGANLQHARVHPLSILNALMTYKTGESARGSSTWNPVAEIVDALDAAFYASFGNVDSTYKRIRLALDISDSMTWSNIAGMPGLTPREGSAALALVTKAREPFSSIVAFSGETVPRSLYRNIVHGISPLAISPRQRLDDVIGTIRGLRAGPTDCALPMTDAMEKEELVDAFVILTDNETWSGGIHPAQALQQYRQRSGIDAKLIVVGMVSNGFSIADPRDAGMLDVVGFDAATPQLISEFVAGRV